MICEQGKKNWRYLPLTKSFQVCHQKIYLSLLRSTGIQLIPVEFWLHPSMNAENVGSLPPNISEDAQQSSSTYKNFHYIFGPHMCMGLFASVENSVMSH